MGKRDSYNHSWFHQIILKSILAENQLKFLRTPETWAPQKFPNYPAGYKFGSKLITYFPFSIRGKGELETIRSTEANSTRG
jgi:hypothetical protein